MRPDAAMRTAAQEQPIPDNAITSDESRMTDDARADRETGPLQLTVIRSMAEAEPVWRRMEARGCYSPYQRFSWITALLAARPERELAIAVITAGDEPVALLPLAIRSQFGVRTASLLGGDIGNCGLPLLHRTLASLLTPAELDRLARVLAETAQFDLLVLQNQPDRWQGLPNPLLALPHQPGPDHLYLAPLTGDRLNAKRLRNLARGKRRLEEAFGPVTLRRAENADDIARVHAEFLRQRDIRFREMGVRNSFADPWFTAFFRTAGKASLGSSRPAMAFHALYAGEAIVATAIGTYAGAHYSQYINSTTDGPAAKYSLMGILMSELAEELRADGITSIDMGLGDFDYKTDWTDPQPVYDSIVPLSAKGGLAAPLLREGRRLKRAIKQNPKLFGLAKRVRLAASAMTRTK